MQSFIDVCAAVGHLTLSTVYCGIPVRGAIAIGDISVCQTSFAPQNSFEVRSIVGAPLVEAYEEEGKCQWMGCVIADACLEHYSRLVEAHSGTVPDIANVNHLLSFGLIDRYPVPLKTGDSQERWVINWPRFHAHFPSSPANEMVQTAFKSHGKRVDSSSVSKKLAHTLRFLEHARSKAQMCGTGSSSDMPTSGHL